MYFDQINTNIILSLMENVHELPVKQKLMTTEHGPVMISNHSYLHVCIIHDLAVFSHHSPLLQVTLQRHVLLRPVVTGGVMWWIQRLTACRHEGFRSISETALLFQRVATAGVFSWPLQVDDRLQTTPEHSSRSVSVQHTTLTSKHLHTDM